VPPFGITLLVLGLIVALLWLVLQRVGRLDQRLGGTARQEDLSKLADSAASDARLKPIEEGVRRLGEAIARLPAPLEAKDLVPVQERLELLSRVVDELRHHVDELRSREPGGADVGPGAKVLRTLEQRGFDSIRILSQVSEDEAGASARIPVEAHRAGMSFKGFVTLEEGRVADVALKPVTEVFP
jgi:hypothetical protein